MKFSDFLNESKFEKGLAVYMFEKGNEYRYLVGYFDKRAGETDEDFLSRIAKSESKDIEYLRIERK